MKKIIQNEALGEIVYNESIWTGKKSLTVNGVEAKKITKKEYQAGDKKLIISGNYYFTGITLTVGDEIIEVSPKPKWYEFVFAILPLLFLLIWGNSYTLCDIFPVVGGAIGGFIGALFSIASLLLTKKTEKPLYKVLIGIGIFVANVLVAFGLACLILQML